MISFITIVLLFYFIVIIGNIYLFLLFLFLFDEMVPGESPAWEPEMPNLDLAMGDNQFGSPSSIQLEIRDGSSRSSFRGSESSELRGSRGGSDHVTFNLDSAYDNDESGIRPASESGNANDDVLPEAENPSTFLGTSQSLLNLREEGKLRKITSFHEFPRAEELSKSAMIRRSSLPTQKGKNILIVFFIVVYYYS